MQAGIDRPVWRKGEAGELFKRIFEATFTSTSNFNPLFDVEVEMVELRLGSECFLEDPLIY